MGYISTLCTVDSFIHAFYGCFYHAILIRRFDQAIRSGYCKSNFKSNLPRLDIFFCLSWKKHGTVTNSFQNLKCFLLKEDDSIDRNHAMSYCCFECFKNCVSNFLYDEFILLTFKKKIMLQNVKAKDLFIFRSGFCFLVCFYDTYCLVFIIDRGEKII